MDAPIGRWLDTVTEANMPFGDLVWLPVAKGRFSGLRGQVVTMESREFAVLRPQAAGGHQQWSVRIQGFVWAITPDKNVAARFGVSESPVGAFSTLTKARVAVIEAHRLLQKHLRQKAA